MLAYALYIGDLLSNKCDKYRQPIDRAAKNQKGDFGGMRLSIGQKGSSAQGWRAPIPSHIVDYVMHRFKPISSHILGNVM